MVSVLAQLVGMSALLAIAMKEKKILVMSYYNRADHGVCEGGDAFMFSLQIII